MATRVSKSPGVGFGPPAIMRHGIAVGAGQSMLRASSAGTHRRWRRSYAGCRIDLHSAIAAYPTGESMKLHALLVLCISAIGAAVAAPTLAADPAPNGLVAVQAHDLDKLYL